MKQVKEYFELYPASNECHTTSDGLVFHQKGDANLHANSLKDKEVETHKRVKMEVAKDETSSTTPKKTAAEKKAEKEAAEKAAAEKEAAEKEAAEKAAASK